MNNSKAAVTHSTTVLGVKGPGARPQLTAFMLTVLCVWGIGLITEGVVVVAFTTGNMSAGKAVTQADIITGISYDNIYSSIAVMMMLFLVFF